MSNAELLSRIAMDPAISARKPIVDVRFAGRTNATDILTGFTGKTGSSFLQ